MLETTIALFLLVGAMTVASQLFHRASQMQSHSELRASALTLANARLEEVREAARDINEFASKLASVSGTSSVAGHPELEVTVAVDDLSAGDRKRYVPSTTLEANFQGPAPIVPEASPPEVLAGVSDDRKRLESSLLVVDVTVRSRQNKFPPVVLTGLIREPVRTLGSVVITGPPPPLVLSYRSSLIFTAEVRDSGGNRIEDAMLVWDVAPLTGYGTVYQSRDGKTASLCYLDFNANGNVYQPTAGECRLKATARVDGQTVFAYSDIVVLQP